MGYLHSSQMGVHLQPVQEDALLSFGGAEKGMVSDSKHRTKLNCTRRGACAPRPFKRKSSFAFSVHLLGLTFTSLAIVYFLLRCFESAAEVLRVTSLRRSLAAGGGGKCSGVGNGQEDEEEGENAVAEDLWIAELEETAEELGGESLYRRSIWSTGYPVGWPSTPTTTDEYRATTDAGLYEAEHRISSGKGLGAAGSAHEFPAAKSQDAGPPELLLAQEGPASQRRKPRAPQVKGTDKRLSKNGGHAAGPGVNLRPGETWEMWEGRNLPPYAQQQVVHLLHRMMYAASLCRKLLPRLTQSQRLRVSRELVKLLALQLGAFSLVNQGIQDLRVKLADVLLQLVNDALRRGGDDAKLEEYRSDLRILGTLIEQLKQPRPATEISSPYCYRAKMISLLKTATEVEKFFVGVLEGLFMFEAVNSRKPAPELISQQARVLSKLFEAHSAHIARDATLRHYIVECQRNIGMRPLLSRRHLEMSSQDLPPMSHIANEIRNAVKAAGGLIQLPPQPTSTHQSSAAAAHTITQQKPASHGPLGEERQRAQQQERFGPASQPSRVSASTGLHNLQATASHPLSTQSHIISHSLPAPSEQRRYATGNAGSRLQLSPPQPRQTLFGLPTGESHPQPPGSHYEIWHPRPMTTITGRAPTGFTSMYASGHGRGSTAPLPPLAMPQDSLLLRLPCPQQIGPVIVGAPAYVEVPGYPRHDGLPTSGYGARLPLLTAASRRTEHPSGDTSTFNYGRAPVGGSHQQEAEREEEVEGLLAELIKGDLDSVFSSRKP